MKLLKIELLKMKANYTLHAFLLVYMVMVPLTFIAIGNFDIESILGLFSGGQNTGVDMKDIFKFPHNWEILPYLASWFNVILSVGVIHFVSMEFSAGMYKKTFIDGLKREELYLGKLLMVAICSAFCTLYLLILIGGFGLVYFEMSEASEIFNFEPLLLYFFQTLCYFSFALCLITLVKNSTTAILVFIGYYFLEWIVSIPMEKSLEIFLPFEAFSEIVPFPFIDQINEGLENSNDLEVKTNTYMAPCISIAYLLVMQGVTFLVLKTRSL